MINFFKKMKYRKAKKVTIEVWSYLRDHPEISEKKDLPENLYRKIAHHIDRCPLCSIFRGRSNNSCNGCPLVSCSWDSDYMGWAATQNSSYRSEKAASILKKVEEWKI